MAERVISEFNTAIGFTNRVNSLLWIIDNASMGLDAYTWYHTLITLYREASTFMNAQELTQAEGFMIKITPYIANYQKTAGMQGYNKIEHDFYQLLHQFDLFLRKCLKETGLLTKLSDNPSMAFSGGN